MRKDEVRKAELTGWPLPDEYLIELGRVIAAWGALEGQLDTYLGKLAGFNDLTDPRPFILVKHSSFPQKLDVLSALCEQLGSEHSQLRGYKSAVGKLRAAQAERNRYLHNGLSVDPETGQVVMAIGSARGRLKVAVEAVDVVDIKRASMEIHKAMLELHRLITGKRYPPKWKRKAP